MAEKTFEEVLNGNKKTVLKALDAALDGKISRERCRELIIQALDIIGKEAIEQSIISHALEKTMNANGLDSNDAQLVMDYYHFKKLEEQKRAQGEQYIFGDPDKPENKTKETTSSPG